MSLALVQDYSSEEEREKDELPFSDDDEGGSGEEEDDDNDDGREMRPKGLDAVHDVGGIGSGSEPPRAGSSLLPSPEDLFSEVTGPPEFLKSSATEPLYARANDSWQPPSGQPAHRSDPVTDSVPGVVLETNAKSSGLSKQGQAAAENGTRSEKESARSAASGGAAARENISAPARLYIGAEIKPTTDADKRNRPKIKDKEKNKRMKGQSSHATWKSETEMHLRQQFD
ncbi:unnamed protein product [Calypogeia fissa]